MTEKAERTILGEDAYLYKLPGKDPSRNVLLMVAPRRRGSDRAAGRSALCRRHPRRKALGTRHGRHQDAAVCGVFRARGLLLEGFEFPVNVYLFSSHNEEYSGDGALLAHDYFIEHSIRFDWISDEGGAVIAPPMPGIDKKCAMIAVHEKGRCTAQLVAEPQQGARGTCRRAQDAGSCAWPPS